MNENVTKTIFAVFFAGISAYLQSVAIPIIILLIVIVIDYISGMTKAFIRNEVSSKAGIIGIIKKVCYLLVVCVAICVDWVIQYAFDNLGIEVGNLYFVGLIVVVWLIINECISILENLALIGVPMPEFLVKIVKKLKVAVDNRAKETGVESIDIDTDEGDEGSK